MRDKHWVVVILATHPLYFPSSNLLDLNSNLYAGLWVLWVHRQRGNSCIKCLSPTSTVQRSPSWSLQVLSYWGSFSTLTQPPHHQLVCISTTWKLQACVSAQLPQGLESSHFFARPPAPPYARKANFYSTSKSGFQPCFVEEASAVSSPTGLVLLFLGWNRALYILLTILHLFCLLVCFPSKMLSSWEHVCVIHLHP